ncbi:MAG: hypothetical protein NTY77_12150 [Elusimicrobia bacterium]|nr:hypothetical protein [Elusimicrobiota bacterium]
MGDQLQEQRGISDKHHEKVEAAKASPHVHVPRLITSQHGHAHVHGTGTVGRFNNRLAVLITQSVGTMWAAYLFFLIALVSMPQAWAAFIKGDTVTGVSWLSQSFLQLVLLPIIIVGQNVISASQDARAEADHLTLTALHAINIRQLAILEQQQKILDLLHQKKA